MEVTIEQIEGKPHTVVWHSPILKCETLGRRFANLRNNTLAIFRDADCLEHIATALPALPRYPQSHPDSTRRHPRNTEEMDRLKALYRAHGLLVIGYEKNHGGGLRYIQELGEIAHAIDSATGERVSIAITEEPAQ